MDKPKPNICNDCIHDCFVVDETFKKCINFEKGLHYKAYEEILKRNHVDIWKMCYKYGLKRHYLNQMMDGKMRFSYKYTQAIMDCTEKYRVQDIKSMYSAEQELNGK